MRGIAGIFDLSDTAAGGTVRIAFDGHLHNAADVRAALGARGRPVDTLSDPDLVLLAYGIWGPECVARLLGEFAFAIHDGGSRELFCARDRLGVRPFHFRFDGRTFAFASDIGQLLDLTGLKPDLNEAMLGLVLADSCIETEETLYAGVMRLPAAHSLRVSTRGLSRTRYWQLDPPCLLRYRSDDAYAEHFRALFVEAVRCRVDSVARAGVLVSGGVDSSAIACVAPGAELFSSAFEDPACDERRYLRHITEASGRKAHVCYPESDDHAGLDLDADEPYPRGPLYYPNLSMLRAPLHAARASGVELVLTGLGGDDLFTGSYHPADLLRRGRWAAFRRELRWVRGQWRLGLVPALVKFALRPLVPTPLVGRRRPRVPAWLQPQFVARCGLLDRLRSVRRRPLFPDAGRQVLYDSVFSSGAYQFGFEEEHRFTRRVPVEASAPLFDLRLVDFALSLPPEQRTWGGQTKVVLRNGLRGVLPDAVRLRADKADFAPFVDRELRTRQRRQVDSLFSRPLLAESGVVDGRAMGETWRRYCDGALENRWTVLTLLNMERALRAVHS